MDTLGNICTRDAVIVNKQATIKQAAELMRSRHVGSLVVVDTVAEEVKPIGLITDRDILLAIVAMDLDPNVFLLEDMLERPLITGLDTASAASGLRLMRKHGIRRLPVVDKGGVLVGIITLDDLLRTVSHYMNDVVKLLATEATTETRLRKSVGVQ
jgi:CBS domain-containing protein